MKKTKMTAVAATTRRSGRQIEAGLDVDGGDRLNKNKRSARNDGKPAVLVDRRVTRLASKWQEQENDENKRIRDYGFDVGDIPPNAPTIFGELEFESIWTENSLGRAPMIYENMAKIGLKTFNLQNRTSYEFTKIVRVNALSKYMYGVYKITFLAGADSFEAKAGSIGDFTVVPFCKKGLDVSLEQLETFSDLTRSAIKEQKDERQKLLKEEDKRIKKRCGPEFDGKTLVNDLGTFNPCWSESSGSPAPKIYEELSKIGIDSYNDLYGTYFQFVKLLRVYYQKEGKRITRFIYFEVENTLDASIMVFYIIALSNFESVVVCRVAKEKPSKRDVGEMASDDSEGDVGVMDTEWVWYWSGEDRVDC